MTTAHRLCVLTLLGTWFAAAGALTAAAQTAVRRLDLGVAAGIFAASDDAVTAVYPGAKVPVAVWADVNLTRHLSVFAGGRFLDITGHPVATDSGVAEPDSDVELSVRAAVFGARVHYRRGRGDVTAGVGAAHSSYTESWAGTSESVSGNAWGPVLDAGFAFRLSQRVAAIGRVQWGRVSTGQGSVGSPSVQLGGIDVLAGFAVSF